MAAKGCSYIVFVDETGFMLGPVLRRTWAPRGKTPVIKVTKPHERISAIGAMALQREPIHFGFYFHLLEDNANFNGKSIATFVAQDGAQVSGTISRGPWWYPLRDKAAQRP